MGVVTFDFDAFATRYPEFAYIGDVQAEAYFEEATLYLDNTGQGAVTDPARLAQFLNMIVAHLAQINSGVNGQDASPLVGRISSASEGSVSVSVDAGASGSATQAWWQQTKYGASFWTLTARYRRFRYVRANPNLVYAGFNRTI